jgi:hypothetical protein
MPLYFAFLSIVALPFIVILLLYYTLTQNTNDNAITIRNSQNNVFLPKVKPLLQPDGTIVQPKQEFTKIVKNLFDIGVSNSTHLYKILTEDDVFDVFESPLLLNHSCPTNRIDIPSVTNQHNLDLFLNNEKGSFIFYQHLRKAGGTGFCDLAKTNLGPRAVPAYYCMPDQVELRCLYLLTCT